MQALLQPQSVLGSRSATTADMPQLVHPAGRTLLAGQLVILRMPASSAAVPIKLQLGSAADALHCTLAAVPAHDTTEDHLFAGCWNTAIAGPALAEAVTADLLVLVEDRLVQVLPCADSSEATWTTGW